RHAIRAISLPSMTLIPHALIHHGTIAGTADARFTDPGSMTAPPAFARQAGPSYGGVPKT
ncbi:MAG TPA: hypothetical protein DD668_14815, partial [Alphaproteobacteria bacterium]|nr:hypothetical protein [Alphaproteobacteria bacterium]